MLSASVVVVLEGVVVVSAAVSVVSADVVVDAAKVVVPPVCKPQYQQCELWMLCLESKKVLLLVTGCIARSANLPVFSLLRGRF